MFLFGSVALVLTLLFVAVEDVTVDLTKYVPRKTTLCLSQLASITIQDVP